MKILLICTFLFLIILYIDLKTYGNKYDEEKSKRMEKEDEIINYLTENYDYMVSSIIDESVEEVKEMDLKSEEDILEQLQQKIINKFEVLLVEREKESILKKLDNEILQSYIATKLIDLNISEILDIINSKRYNQKENNDISIATEKVSNNTKVDSSVIDITDELNNIFFGE